MTTALDSHEELRAAIAALDLDPIKFKLMHSDKGQGWNREQVDRVEELYRKFLFLSITNREPIPPTKEIDTFWHAHILDTYKYHEDCQAVFGFYLHHFPYFGMRGPEDEAKHKAAAKRAREIWQKTFGITPENAALCPGGYCDDVHPQKYLSITRPDLRPSLA